MKLLDTSVVIDHLRLRSAASAMLRRLTEQDEALLASELTRFELVAGARPKEIEALEAFSRDVAWVPVTEDVARTAGRFASLYRRSHSGIGDVDYLIAATSVVIRADLLTTNVRHFPMLPGLEPAY